ncbi:MAG: SDR family oxidoreductase [Dermatophilaceae bacterium]
MLVTGAGTGFGLATAQACALVGYTVYASMRDLAGNNAARAATITAWAREQAVELHPLELDVLSQDSCDRAIQQILDDTGQLDVVVNNAGMLLVGPTEAFTPEQVLHCFDTNTVGPLRVNRAVLPHFRSRRAGLIVWVGSVTSDIISPFQGPYVAAKAAEDRLAETTFYENTPYGIDAVIVQPGAYTTGTNHFPGAQYPADPDRRAQYDEIAEMVDQLAANLDSLAEPGARTDIGEIADAIAEVIAAPAGQRPFRIVIDPQHHGAQECNAIRSYMQERFMERAGLTALRHPRLSDAGPSEPSVAAGPASTSIAAGRA